MEPPTEPIRVLHVDDDRDFVELAATYVEREDDRFDVTVASDAGEGLDRLENGDFDCVVSDYDMPGLTGIEFLERVRETRPDLPFILYTGKGSEEVASEAISAGVTDYLQKGSGTSQYAVLANRIGNAVEKYRAQSELADRERRLDLLFERSPLGTVEWTDDFEFLRVNDAAEEILGYPESELVGQPWETVLTESGRPVVENAAAILREDEGGYHVVTEAVRRDGERIVCEWHNRVVTGDDGDVVARFSQFQDVTERRKHEQRFEAIFNNTYTFTGLMEPDGTLIEANDTALSFGGLDRDDVVGEPLWEAAWFRSNPEARATARTAVERARDGELFRDEIRVQGSDREAVIDFSVRPVVDERGEVILLVPEGRDITERTDLEHKRQQIIDRVTDAVVEVDANWRLTLLNEQAEELYDVDAATLLDRDFWEAFPEVRNTRFEEVYRRVMETREPTSFVDYYAELDGWFDVDVYPEDHGGLAFYLREVTDRIRRLRELERTRDLLDHTERIADVGGWEIDTDTLEVFWTDNLFDLLGIDHGEEPPLDEALDVYHEADRPRVERAIEEALDAAEPFDVEARFQRADGQTRWFRVRGVPTVEDGEVVTLRGAVQDVTDRKEREGRLEETTSRLRALFENSPDMIDVLDSEGTLLEVNRRFREELGYDEEEVIGEPIWAFDRLVDEAEVRALLSEFDLDERRRFEGEYVRRDGSSFPVEVNLLRLEIEGEIRFLAISRDITDRKRHARQLERQLRQFESFGGVLSHDLRTPLNTLAGRLELARETTDDDEHLAAAERALERIETLVEDLASAMQEGQLAGDRTVLDLDPVCRSCWDVVETDDATLVVEETRSLRADETALSRLFENLIRNAVEHNHGDVTVRIGILSDGFYVEDDGDGIPEAARDRVFDPGFTTKEDGTGLGMVSVQQIALAHGWEVTVADGADGGARFEFTDVDGA
ncbi:hybrid sensor histidine kinase/response regulator [Haloplanus halophilus]|uniref:hybrid sensor histidine kinase/response regulator n=1 Tax=Haloplanus halophilus TaxID=2949993 RepID=UPI00203D8DD4|nr:PAS domain S-box protein [Haloplanus sp. GDY1]